MLEYGLPPHIANSSEAQTAFVVGAGRTTALGVVLGVLYWKGRYKEVDLVFVVLGGILGVVDWGVCVQEGLGGWGSFRLVTGLGIAG